MQKNFVLDTNVLLHDPYALNKFEDNTIWLSSKVTEELDDKKNPRKDVDREIAMNARETFRILKGYREKGSLLKGVKTAAGGTIRLIPAECGKNNITETDNKKYNMLPIGYNPGKDDNIILLETIALKNLINETVYLVTNDGGVQIKADVLDIPVQEYKNDRVGLKDDLYKGRSECTISGNDMDRLYEAGSIRYENPAFENEFFLVRDDSSTKSALCIYKNGELRLCKHQSETPSGLIPRNAAQKFCVEALMSDWEDIPLVLISGPAGTGKTLVALACGLEQVMEQNTYSQVLLCRPNVTMGEDLGALPGDEKEKISPLLRGCWDNLKHLYGAKGDSRDDINSKIEFLFQKGFLDAQAVAFLRGRSIENTYMIIDEAQNLTPVQAKSIITRAGMGTKIVMLGCPDQIDVPHLDRYNNGLVYAIEKMKVSNSSAIMTFRDDPESKECIRSYLAQESSRLMK